MLICIAELLPKSELEQVRRLLEGQSFKDGQLTAGWAAKLVKNNLQLDSGAQSYKELQAVVARAMARNEVFAAAAMPKSIRPILFSRYEVGMSYGDHVDNAMMGEEPRIRSDLSFTIFISDTADYEGGELVVEEPSGIQSYKLPAGAMVLYPSSSLHRVEPVTAGVRLVAVGWLQSLIRRPDQRQLLFELENVRREIFRKEGKSPAFDSLSKSISNLWRMWAEP